MFPILHFFENLPLYYPDSIISLFSTVFLMEAMPHLHGSLDSSSYSTPQSPVTSIYSIRSPTFLLLFAYHYIFCIVIYLATYSTISSPPHETPSSIYPQNQKCTC